MDSLVRGRRWLDQALARTPAEPTYERVEAIYYAKRAGQPPG